MPAEDSVVAEDALCPRPAPGSKQGQVLVPGHQRQGKSSRETARGQPGVRAGPGLPGVPRVEALTWAMGWMPPPSPGPWAGWPPPHLGHVLDALAQGAVVAEARDAAQEAAHLPPASSHQEHPRARAGRATAAMGPGRLSPGLLRPRPPQPGMRTRRRGALLASMRRKAGLAWARGGLRRRVARC